MIGQSSLINKLSKYSLKDFPHTVLLLGENGSGKHTFVNEYISKQFSLDVYDITEDISLETINEIITYAKPAIYLINCDNITIKEQNIILKFIEEPVKQIYVLLLSSNKNLVLDTVIGRCQIWNMDLYSTEELMTFTQDPEVLAIAKTPGQILNFTETNITEIKRICNILFTKSANAALGNLFTISNKINWKDDANKFDYNVFLKCLIDEITTLYCIDPNYYKAYTLTQDLIIKSSVLYVDRQRLFEKFIVNLKYLMKEDMSNAS